MNHKNGNTISGSYFISKSKGKKVELIQNQGSILPIAHNIYIYIYYVLFIYLF